jgi:hypothetical protein
MHKIMKALKEDMLNQIILKFQHVGEYKPWKKENKKMKIKQHYNFLIPFLKPYLVNLIGINIYNNFSNLNYKIGIIKIRAFNKIKNPKIKYILINISKWSIQQVPPDIFLNLECLPFPQFICKILHYKLNKLY